MDKELNLGVIGMSEGNGHPYSWAAIFNGFDEQYMKDCPFPVIPEYLAAQNFPEDAIKGAKVTHVWAQEKEISEHISKSSKTPHVSESLEEMAKEVDAVLLARDDAENHLEMAEPFLKAGLPIFIDKPLAYTMEEAEEILLLQQKADQIFTCSSLRYAKEFDLDERIKADLGEIKFIEAISPKSWLKYGIHIVQPVLGMLPNRGKLQSVENTGTGELNLVTVKWENAVAQFKTTGDLKTNINIKVFGGKETKVFDFADTFYAFKSSLQHFVDVIQNKRENISLEETLEVIKIIDSGTIR